MFFYNDFELAQMTLGQVHDTPKDQKQSLCEEGTFNVSPKERYRADTNYKLFLPMTFELVKRP